MLGVPRMRTTEAYYNKWVEPRLQNREKNGKGVIVMHGCIRTRSLDFERSLVYVFTSLERKSTYYYVLRQIDEELGLCFAGLQLKLWATRLNEAKYFTCIDSSNWQHACSWWIVILVPVARIWFSCYSAVSHCSNERNRIAVRAVSGKPRLCRIRFSLV